MWGQVSRKSGADAREFILSLIAWCLSEELKEDGMNEDKLLYSRTSAAAALDLSQRTIDGAIRSGALKTVKIGRRIMIDARSLRAFASRSRGRIREGPARKPSATANAEIVA
jgi:helix-turn-helix protein